MRNILAALLLLSPVLCRAAVLPAQFENSVVNSAGTVVLKAAPAYNADQQGKGEAVAQAARALGIPVDKPVAVQWPGGGELWTMKDIGAVKLDSWSDKALPLGPNSQNGGRWFGFFGIQSMGGGDFPSSSMNLRVGSTLFKNQYDLAYTCSV